MTTTRLACDQAIFTSIRTPMGEGYRIVAAGAGLGPEEKQAIIRNSPSHDGLCHAPSTAAANESGVGGAAFYALPGGRLCVAVSCAGGAEHTGRGGQRIYTHNVIVNERSLVVSGYNPFHIVRAMVAAGLTTPQLKPPSVLPTLELAIAECPSDRERPALHETLDARHRAFILDMLLNGRKLIVNVDGDWMASAEALLTGVPGLLRLKISFGAGLRFSIGRCHQLHLLYDKTPQTRTRVTGQPVTYLDARDHTTPTTVEPSAWLTFVERHWSRGDLRTLARRTSRAFDDVARAGRERVGRLYNFLDEMPRTETGTLLRHGDELLQPGGDCSERDLVREVLHAARACLEDRLREGAVADARRLWPAIENLWRQSQRGTAFTQPLIQSALRRMRDDDPLAAAEAACEVARDIPALAVDEGHLTMLDEQIRDLEAWSRRCADFSLERFARICSRWRALRPECAIVDRLHERLSALQECPPAPVCPTGRPAAR